jgi:hypothetical protein
MTNLKVEYHGEKSAHVKPFGKQTANKLGKLDALRET